MSHYPLLPRDGRWLSGRRAASRQRDRAASVVSRAPRLFSLLYCYRRGRVAAMRFGLIGVALAVSAGASAHDALAPNPAFAHYPQYLGTLGSKRIVLRLGVKPDDPDELNGEYQYVPNGPSILVAGARDGNTLTLEESDDGTEISGQWVAQFADDGSLSGARMNDDETDQQPVALRPAASTSAESTPPPSVPLATPSSAPPAVVNP